MRTVRYQEFRAAVCDSDGCWSTRPLSEAGVSVDKGAGWAYFLSERHFETARCVGRRGITKGVCDAVAVPRQYRRQIVFLELKTSGSYPHAVDQIRACVELLLAFDIPSNVALTAEIWHSREPKSQLAVGRSQIKVAGRTVLIRRKRSGSA